MSFALCKLAKLTGPLSMAACVTMAWLGAVIPIAAAESKAAQPPTASGAPALTATSKETDSKSQAAWVKVCEKATFKTGTVEEQKAVCLTHHERIDVNTGMVLISAAIRQIEGQPQPILMIMVPVGLAIQPGLQVKIDGREDILRLKYSLCHVAGCTAEIDAPAELIEKMKSGPQLLVAAMNISGSPVGFPVPLAGFGTAFDGPPMDPQTYANARKGMMDIVKKHMTEQQQKAAKASP